MEKVKIINESTNDLPSYKTEGSAGMDLRANLDKPVELKPLERQLIPTGLYIELPKGNEAQIRPRSGMALKKGISVLNSPGTVDSDFRGEIGVILINLSNENFTVEHGDRVAQMVISKYEKVELEEKISLNTTERGSGGYGHTGMD